MPDELNTTRSEIADLYFWLGAEAETVGFTPWIVMWLGERKPEPLTAPVVITRFLDGSCKSA